MHIPSFCTFTHAWNAFPTLLCFAQILSFVQDHAQVPYQQDIVERAPNYESQERGDQESPGSATTLDLWSRVKHNSVGLSLFLCKMEGLAPS